MLVEFDTLNTLETWHDASDYLDQAQTRLQGELARPDIAPVERCIVTSYFGKEPLLEEATAARICVEAGLSYEPALARAVLENLTHILAGVAQSVRENPTPDELAWRGGKPKEVYDDSLALLAGHNLSPERLAPFVVQHLRAQRPLPSEQMIGYAVRTFCPSYGR